MSAANGLLPGDGILVIDDAQQQRDATVEMFRSLGYRCKGCGSGKEALNILQHEPAKFSLCLLDQELRGQSARASPTPEWLDTLVKIRGEHPRVRVIVHTAYDDKGEIALRSGASFYARKPVSGQYLAMLVSTLLRMKELEDRIALTAGQRDLLQDYLDAIGVQLMVRDPDYNILLINTTGRSMHGIHESVVGRKCYEVFEGRKRPCPGCPDDEAMRGKNIVSKEWPLGNRVLLITAGPILDSKGNVKAIVEVTIDITRRKKTAELIEAIQKATVDSVDAVAGHVVRGLHEVGYSRVRLYLKEGDALVGHACEGMQADFDIRQIVLGKGGEEKEAMQAAKAGRAVLLRREQFSGDPSDARIGLEGVRAKILVPLVSHGDKIGLITVDDKEGPPLTEEDVDNLTFLGGAVTDAINNAKTVEEKNKQIHWLEGIRRIDEELTAASNPRKVYRAVVATLTDLLGAVSAWLLFRDHQHNPLETGAVAGDSIGVTLPPHPGDIGVVGRCLRENKLQVVPDVWDDPDFVNYFNSLEDNTAWKKYLACRRTLLAIPVRCGREAIGACVVHFDKPFALSRDEEVFVQDIVERVAIVLAKLEEQRRVEAVAIANAKLSDLALLGSGVAHSLRTPVATAMSAINVAETEQMSDLARVKLREACGELRSASEMVARLLRWVRPEGVTPVIVSLPDLIEELKEIIGQKLQDSSVRLIINADESAKPVFVAADPLKMAILDFFVNAVRAMPDGGDLTVSISNVPRKPVVALKITDTGKGMSEEQVREVFSGIQATSPKAGGIGLGLYLAEKVIKAAGGEIACQSTPGKGTTFTIFLPCKEDSNA